MNASTGPSAEFGLNYAEALACTAQDRWFGVHPENYSVGGPDWLD